MAENQLVGGLRCFEVLALLSDYLDGELEATARGRVEAHLAGCEACTQFGGEFGAVVGALRKQLTSSEAPGAAELPPGR